MEKKYLILLILVPITLGLLALWLWQKAPASSQILVGVNPADSQILLDNTITIKNGVKTKTSPGDHSLTINKIGFESQEKYFSITPKQSLEFNFTLLKTVVWQPLTTLNELTGFLQPTWLDEHIIIAVNPANNSLSSYDIETKKVSDYSKKFPELLGGFVLNNPDKTIFLTTGMGDDEKFYILKENKNPEEINLTNYYNRTNFIFNPEGQLIFTAIAKNNTAQLPELYLMTLNDSKIKSISPDVFIQAVKIFWLNSNRMLIYFESDSADSGKLSLFNFTSQKLTNLTPNDSFSNNPSLSLDKNLLIYRDKIGIKLIKTDSFEKDVLVQAAPKNFLHLPIIWLDNQRILLINADSQLAIYDLSNGQQTAINSAGVDTTQIINAIPSPSNEKNLVLAIW